MYINIEKIKIQRKKHRRESNGWIAGGKKLSSSEHYPTELCKAIARGVAQAAELYHAQ